MSKWQVKKIPNYFFSPDRLEWVAWLDGNWAECRGFRTHAEALAYADERARTRTYVLPRVHALPTGRHTVHRNGLIVEFKQSRSWTQLKPGYITVEPGERRPLALALLALAEKENDKENTK